MALSIKEIQAPVKDELVLFEEKFKGMMKSRVMLLDQIMGYIVKRKGKQIRPLFVFLTAKLLGDINDRTYRGAALIELLHTATLVHDDVVDDSYYRRGFFSVNALWKNKIAVLVGDYLLSRGLLLSVDNNDFDLLKLVSHAVREMSEGELLQMEKARRLDITEEVYFNIIRQKTASLMASCTAVGAASVGSSFEEIEKMRLFGELAGIAFQIKDDLFDYGDAEIGKPVGIDIRERKMTLPLIYALNNTGKSEKNKIINIIKNENEKTAKVKYVIDFVKNTGGIKYAQETMEGYFGKASAILDPYQGETKEALVSLLKYTMERKK